MTILEIVKENLLERYPHYENKISKCKKFTDLYSKELDLKKEVNKIIEKIQIDKYWIID